jgi:hypothetical protein
VRGDLCKLCDQALKSSDSSDDYVLQKLPLVNTFLTTGRPFGVTILALWNYSVALVALFSGLGRRRLPEYSKRLASQAVMILISVQLDFGC